MDLRNNRVSQLIRNEKASEAMSLAFFYGLRDLSQSIRGYLDQFAANKFCYETALQASMQRLQVAAHSFIMAWSGYFSHSRAQAVQA